MKLKKYKIVKKDDSFKLYERQNGFILGLIALPFALFFWYLIFIVKIPNTDPATYLAFIMLLITAPLSTLVLTQRPYRYKQTFSSYDDLRKYIAEQTNTYYLD